MWGTRLKPSAAGTAVDLATQPVATQLVATQLVATQPVATQPEVCAGAARLLQVTRASMRQT